MIMSSTSSTNSAGRASDDQTGKSHDKRVEVALPAASRKTVTSN